MRPIDGHAHVGRWLLEEFNGRHTTVDDALQVYLRWNWAGALLFPTDEGDNEGLLAAVAAVTGPVALRAGFWADFRTPGNLEFFAGRTESFGVLKLHPSCLRTAVTDPRWRAYCEVAAARGLPMVVHCGRWREIAGLEHALALAADHPECPVILAHMGGDSPDLVEAAVAGIRVRRLDNAFLGTESIREPWLLENAVARLGASRLIFGSDYNLNHPEMFRRLLEVLDITDDDRERIMRTNLNGLMPSHHRFF